MRPEELAHARLYDRRAPFRVQPAAVDDTHAPAPPVTAVLEESPDDGAGVRHRLAVQVGSVFDVVCPALQLSDLAPVDAGGGEVLQTIFNMLGGRHRLPRRTHCRRCPDAAARIGAKTDDVGHLAFECFGVGLGVEVAWARHAGGRATWLRALLHRNNCSPRLILALELSRYPMTRFPVRH